MNTTAVNSEIPMKHLMNTTAVNSEIPNEYYCC